MLENRVFTSESVTEGHPDKVCDQIADAILDAHLAQDPLSRVACEVTVAKGMALLMGEITTEAIVNAQEIAREVVREIGYDRPGLGFDADSIAILSHWNRQSPDIAMGVNAALESRFGGAMDIGAGDQGMMFGFACDETPELMPAPIALAHRLAKRMADVRKSGIIPWMRPDGKSQATIRYEGGVPRHIDAIVLSAQHEPDVQQEDIEASLKEHVIDVVLPRELLSDKTKYWINPTGRFVIGGPASDTGLTGRKIIVDTYGGYASHGGGSFSGKDPTKVDRSACYMARYIAKNIVAAGIARRCHIEVAYAIGVAQPVSLLIETDKPEGDAALTELVRAKFDLRPAAIIERLNLRRSIFRQTAAYGHFGRTDVALPWEATDAAASL